MRIRKTFAGSAKLYSAAHVGIVLGAAWIGIPERARATTHTWLGADGSWGDSTMWSSLPTGNSAETFLGNNGTVSIAGGIFSTTSMHLGHSGANSPGTGKLIVDSGALTATGTITIGDGNAGTLVINGGVFSQTGSNRFFVGGGATVGGLGSGTAYIDISNGTLALTKNGIEKSPTSPGVSTLNMSGGTITLTADNISTNQLAVDKFTFTGGFINNLSSATIHELAGNGSISLRTNSTNLGLTVDQSIESIFFGSIIFSSGSTGKFFKTGPGTLELGTGASIGGANAGFIAVNGGMLRFGGSTQPILSTSTISIAGGAVLDLGAAPTMIGRPLTGTGELKTGGAAVTLAFSTSGTFDGIISGTSQITKTQSTATATLTATQTYTGTTTINNGTLAFFNVSSSNLVPSSPLINVTSAGNLNVSGLAGGLTLAAATSQTLQTTGRVYGNVIVPSGTTVKGTGTFLDSLSVNSGTIGTTGGVGTLTAGSLTLNDAKVNVELNATAADKIVVTTADALSLLGTSTITLTALQGLNAGTYTIIDYSGTPLADLGHLTLASTSVGSFSASLLYNSLDPTSIDLKITGAASSVWNFNGNGNWSEGAKWDGGVPNGIDQAASLGTHGGDITVSPSITLDTNITLGSMLLDMPPGGGGYTILASGNNSLTFDVTSGQASITLLTGGNHTIAPPVVMNKDTTINALLNLGTVSFTGGVTATGRALTTSGQGFISFSSVRAGTFNVTGGSVKITPKGSPNSAAGTSVVDGLTFGGGGALDLTNNAMVVNYTTLGSLLTSTRTTLFNGKLSTSQSAGGHALGYADNAVLNRSSFGGVSVGTNSVLIAYTLSGDANLDGVVNGLDFNSLASNFGATDSYWTQADFNYDGMTNGLDFTAIANQFNQSLGASPGPLSSPGALVPEPMSAALIAIAPMTLLRRRRLRR